MKRTASVLVVTMLVTTTGYAFAATGVTWKGPHYRSTAGLDPYTLTYINYWGGYKSYSQTGAWGYHVYASTDSTYYDADRQWSVESYWSATNYQYIPTTISFDDQAIGGGYHAGGIHATGWYYTNFPNPEKWSQDDNSDTRHEEVKIRWTPSFTPGGYNIEVEYWDPNFDFDTGLGDTGEINVSAYITTAIGRYRIDSTWMCKFTYPSARTNNWPFGC